MIGEIASDYAVDGSQLYDLGCSTNQLNENSVQSEA
jgi:hypothetical protein